MSHIVTIVDRGPRPRRGRRRLPPARPARARPRHRHAVRGRGHRPARQAARLALPGRLRHRLRGASASITTTSTGASRNTSTSFAPGVRGREGTDRGPQTRPPRRRAVPGRRLDRGHDPARRCRLKTIEITVSPTGPDHGRDQRLHRRRVPRGQPVRRAGPGHSFGRDPHRRVPPGPAVRSGTPPVVNNSPDIEGGRSAADPARAAPTRLFLTVHPPLPFPSPPKETYP